jgi:site-specific DNA recombinase
MYNNVNFCLDRVSNGVIHREQIKGLPMKAISYIRCSTEGQAVDGVSLEVQADAIRRYADYKGLTIVEEISDAGVSGGINKARQGFIALLDRIQAGDVQGIILYSLERLSRDMLTLLALERLLHEYDVQLHCLDGQLETASPEGFMNYCMRAFMGEMERRQVKHRTKRALQHKKSKGEVVGTVPFGFQREGDQLIPVTSEQAIIRQANELYQSGHRLVDITNQLNDSGRTTRAGKAWTPMQVKRLLTTYEETFKKGNTKIGQATRQFIEAIA